MHKTAKLQGTLSSTSQSSQTFIYTCKYVVKENLQKCGIKIPVDRIDGWVKHTVRFCRKLGQIF